MTRAKTLKLGPGLALPLDVVTEATAIIATRGAGKSSAAAVLVEEAFTAGVPTVVIDWTGVFWGLRSSADGDGAGLAIYVLGGPHGDVPLEPAAGRLIADLIVDSGHSFVLDLSDFPSNAQMVRFMADFLERLYSRKARARTTLLLVIDEAHQFAPQSPRGGFKGELARLMGAIEQVVGLGRSRGLGVVMTTQRTQALNKAVLDLVETLIVMRMLSPRARNAVKEWVDVKNEDDERGVLASLIDLPTGTAWVWSPLRGILDKVAVRRIRTFDSYLTPRPGEVAVEPTARKELDLDALGEDMRSTVERAKNEDPKELRKQLAQLRRELAKRPTETKVETVTETVRVEIPVVSDELRQELRELGEQVTQIRDFASLVPSVLERIDSLLDQITAAARRASETAPRQPERRGPRAPISPASRGIPSSAPPRARANQRRSTPRRSRRRLPAVSGAAADRQRARVAGGDRRPGAQQDPARAVREREPEKLGLRQQPRRAAHRRPHRLPSAGRRCADRRRPHARRRQRRAINTRRTARLRARPSGSREGAHH